MSYEPIIAGRDAIPTPPERGKPASAWPVLAQLPWIAEAHDAGVSQTASSHPPEAPPAVGPGQLAQLTSHLRITSAAEAAADGERLPRQATSDRACFDPPHQAVRAFQRPPSTGNGVDSTYAAPHQQPGNTQYRRFDAGDPRLSNAGSRPRGDALASRIFQWHAALAPHAGIVVTVALILSVGGLYWLTFGRGSGAIPPGDSLEPIGWSANMSDTLGYGQPSDAPGEANGLQPPVEWSPETPSQPAKLSPVADETTGDSADTPSEVPSLPRGEATSVSEDGGPIAAQASIPQPPVTPTPEAAPFPSTTFAAFDFSQVATQGEPAPSAMANLPTDVMGRVPGPR